MFYNSEKWFILMRKYRTASLISGLLAIILLIFTLPYSFAPFITVGTFVCLSVIFLEWALFPAYEFLRYNPLFNAIPLHLKWATYGFGIALFSATTSIVQFVRTAQPIWLLIVALSFMASIGLFHYFSRQSSTFLQNNSHIFNQEYDITDAQHTLQFHTYYRNALLYSVLVWYGVTATISLSFVDIFIVIGFFGHLALNCLTVSNRWFYIWGPLWAIAYTIGTYFMLTQQLYTRIQLPHLLMLVVLFGVTTLAFTLFRRYKKQYTEQKLLLYPVQVNLSKLHAQ